MNKQLNLIAINTMMVTPIFGFNNNEFAMDVAINMIAVMLVLLGLLVIFTIVHMVLKHQSASNALLSRREVDDVEQHSGSVNTASTRSQRQSSSPYTLRNANGVDNVPASPVGSSSFSGDNEKSASQYYSQSSRTFKDRLMSICSCFCVNLDEQDLSIDPSVDVFQDEYDYIIEKLVIKQVPLSLIATKEDIQERLIKLHSDVKTHSQGGDNVMIGHEKLIDSKIPSLYSGSHAHPTFMTTQSHMPGSPINQEAVKPSNSALPIALHGSYSHESCTSTDEQVHFEQYPIQLAPCHSTKSVKIRKEADILNEDTSDQYVNQITATSPAYVDVRTSHTLTKQDATCELLNQLSSFCVHNVKDPIPKDPLTFPKKRKEYYSSKTHSSEIETFNAAQPKSSLILKKGLKTNVTPEIPPEDSSRKRKHKEKTKVLATQDNKEKQHQHSCNEKVNREAPSTKIKSKNTSNSKQHQCKGYKEMQSHSSEEIYCEMLSNISFVDTNKKEVHSPVESEKMQCIDYDSRRKSMSQNAASTAPQIWKLSTKQTILNTSISNVKRLSEHKQHSTNRDLEQLELKKNKSSDTRKHATNKCTEQRIHSNADNKATFSTTHTQSQSCAQSNNVKELYNVTKLTRISEKQKQTSDNIGGFISGHPPSKPIIAVSQVTESGPFQSSVLFQLPSKKLQSPMEKDHAKREIYGPAVGHKVDGGCSQNNASTSSSAMVLREPHIIMNPETINNEVIPINLVLKRKYLDHNESKASILGTSQTDVISLGDIQAQRNITVSWKIVIKHKNDDEHAPNQYRDSFIEIRDITEDDRTDA